MHNNLLYLISINLHILSAIMWFGGIFYYVFILDKLFYNNNIDATATVNINFVKKFRHITWGCFFLFTLTGLGNLLFKGIEMQQIFTKSFWLSPYGHTLSGKLFIVAIVFILSSVNDFFKIPQLDKISTQKNDMTRIKNNSMLIYKINFALGLVIIASATILVRGL